MAVSISLPLWSHWSQVCKGLSPGHFPLAGPLDLCGLAGSTEPTGSQDQVEEPSGQVFHKCFLHRDFSGSPLYIFSVWPFLHPHCSPFLYSWPSLNMTYSSTLAVCLPKLLQTHHHTSHHNTLKLGLEVKVAYWSREEFIEKILAKKQKTHNKHNRMVRAWVEAGNGVKR